MRMKVRGRTGAWEDSTLSHSLKGKRTGVVLAEWKWQELNLKPLPTCWVLSIIASASAISFWFMPQRLATFVWHL